VDMTEVLNAITVDLTAAEAELQRAEAKVTELREARRGLEFALARYGQTPPAPQPIQDGSDPVPDEQDPSKLRWYLFSKQERIFTAMRELGRPVTVPDVRAKLASVGVPQEARNIKSSLNSMKGTGKVVNLRAGLWALPDMNPANNFGPAVEAGPREASDDGATNQENVVTGTFGASLPMR